MSHTLMISVIAVVVAIVVAIGALYEWLVPGLSSARTEQGPVETTVATWLLHQSVPAEAKARINPLGNDPAGIATGSELFKQKCEICHAYDGAGKTEIGSGEYPRPPALRSMDVASMSDGEIFYHIRNGIRNTGMPAWRMPERQIWQLVAFIRHLPAVAPLEAGQASNSISELGSPHFVGSAACQKCHEDIYVRWAKSRMANVVRDPRQHPDAITPDFSKPDPLLTFSKNDVALVYGSRWKQRYFTQIGDDYFPQPAQWDVAHGKWKRYFVPNDADWWAPLYPPDNFKRPTGPLCDGCHSVNYDIVAKTVSEWNVGCERCHGPGGAHVARPIRDTIRNPGRFDYVHANDTCIQCHSQGRPLKNPIDGKYYDWPVGFHVSLSLSDYWQLEEHKLGETTFTHFADGTAHKNRMQGNDFVQSLMYARRHLLQLS